MKNCWSDLKEYRVYVAWEIAVHRYYNYKYGNMPPLHDEADQVEVWSLWDRFGRPSVDLDILQKFKDSGLLNDITGD